MRKPTDIEKYQGNYSEKGLLAKLSRVTRWAGQKVVYAVLLLYYVLQNPNVSTKDKSKIWGALGYFILPTDLVLDLIPMVGYTDDLAALLIALHAVATNIHNTDFWFHFQNVPFCLGNARFRTSGSSLTKILYP